MNIHSRKEHWEERAYLLGLAEKVQKQNQPRTIWFEWTEISKENGYMTTRNTCLSDWKEKTYEGKQENVLSAKPSPRKPFSV